MAWDVNQYERFRDERARPFRDLLERVRHPGVERAVDLGCGSGELTATLLDRWPEARVVGVDSSPEMLAAAGPRAIEGRLAFELGDAASWLAPEPFDLVISNATMHWLPDHDKLLPHVAGQLAPGGVLAVQMPGNFDAPSHRAIEDARLDGPWADRERAASGREPAIEPLTWYVQTLFGCGFAVVDAWETTYVHVLPGDDAVLEWIKGTALRPVLARMTADEKPVFLRVLAAKLRASYPAASYGTLLPFRRLFFVAQRAGARA